MDKDTTPIGGLSNPLQPTNQLLYTTIFFDVLAIGLSFLVSIFFFAGIVLYILASKAYSYRGIRLKKYPVIGYFLVILCQGGLIFFLVYHGCSVNKTLSIPLLPMMAAVCLIGGYYPLTQIYQHEADLSDGVKTISWLLGKRGTFIFCGSVFAAATLLMFFTFYRQGELRYFLIYLFCMCPMVIFFSRWMQKVWKNERNADFKHSLLMNVLASLCTTICFSVLLIIKIF